MMSSANLNAALPPLTPIKAVDRVVAHAPDPVVAPPPVVETALSKGESTSRLADTPTHTPVLWPAQIDPVAVHAAVLIAQEAYRNQKALEGLAMLVQVSAGTKGEGARPSVRPPTQADPQGNGGFSR